MRTKKWLERNIGTLQGKTIAISGSTGGLGTALCMHLASLGVKLVLMDRNQVKSRALADEIRARFPSTEISHLMLDLTDVGSVKRTVDALVSSPPDGLILNAGAYHVPRFECTTGYENVFQINFVSPYYLARKLKPAMDERGGKIVAVSSIAHNYSNIDVNDVDFRTRKKSSLVYGNAKRYLTYALFDLTGVGKGISVVHPGITLTNITAHYPKLVFALIKYPMKLIFMSPKRASLCILKGLVDDCRASQWIGPKLFNVWGLPNKKPLLTASDEERKAIIKIAETAFNKMELTN